MNSYNVIYMKINDYYKNNKHEGPHINLIISGRLYEKVKKIIQIRHNEKLLFRNLFFCEGRIVLRN